MVAGISAKKENLKFLYPIIQWVQFHNLNVKFFVKNQMEKIYYHNMENTSPKI